jgi:hypothetical protein
MTPTYATGPSHHQHTRGVVPETYAETGALERLCGCCRAEPGVWCTNLSTGELSHAPCVSRTRPSSTPHETGSVPAVGDLDGNTTQPSTEEQST